MTTAIARAIAVLEASPLLDAAWYLARHPEAVALGLGAAEHYLRLGALLGDDPGPAFSSAAYLQAHPQLAQAGINPLLHYLEQGGGRDAARAPVPAAASDSEGLLRRDFQLLQGSVLFDPDFYLRCHPDVAAQGGDPLLHFLRHGAGEDRQPNPWFATADYRRDYMGGAVGNPLAHYLLTPGSEEFCTSPRFDGRSYRARHPDVDASAGKPLEHFLRIGLQEGRSALPLSSLRQALSPRLDLRQTCCTVIVPVYNAAEATEACLRSVLRHTDLSVDRMLIVDDASDAPGLAERLQAFAQHPGVELLRNPENLGYTRSVNRGIDHAGRNDVLLLNSDTVVGPHWLRDLKLAALRGARTGTVTAMSDNAGAFTLVPPEMLPQVGDDALARALSTGAPEPLQVPTGNGFCMYVRRPLLDAIGRFDEASFPVGYGEENDFCMRANAAGWANLVAPGVFVRHRRSASFGARRQQLAEAGSARLAQLHPDYAGAIAGMAQSPGLAEAREIARRRLAARAESGRWPKPRLLFVLATRDGGVPQTNHDLMRALAEDYDCLALCSDGRRLELLGADADGYRLLEAHPLHEPIRLHPHRSAEYDDLLAALLERLGVDLVHIRHLAWHSLNLVEVARGLGLPVVQSFHDFYCLCPSVNLVDDEGRYWPDGVPGQVGGPLWRQDPSAKPMTEDGLARWRANMQQALASCNALVTTSESAKAKLLSGLSALGHPAQPFHVIPHGRDFPGFRQLAAIEPIEGDAPLRVLLPGNIAVHKGAELVRQIKALDADNRIEFHLLGRGDPRLQGCVQAHGPYRREQFAERVATIRPHLAAVLTICPETWCHTLTESWACGLPVLGLDIGAVGERIARHRSGWLLPADATAENLYRQLLSLRSAPDPLAAARAEVRVWQQGPGRDNNVAAMAARYRGVYAGLLAQEVGDGRPERAGRPCVA